MVTDAWIVVQDNGIGMAHADIPLMLGKGVSVRSVSLPPPHALPQYCLAPSTRSSRPGVALVLALKWYVVDFILVSCRPICIYCL